MGVTTLEEVFLKVGDGIIPGYKEEKSERFNEEDNNEMLFEDYSIVTQGLHGFRLTLLQFTTIL